MRAKAASSATYSSPGSGGAARLFEPEFRHVLFFESEEVRKLVPEGDVDFLDQRLIGGADALEVLLEEEDQAGLGPDIEHALLKLAAAHEEAEHIGWDRGAIEVLAARESFVGRRAYGDREFIEECAELPG